MKRIKEEVKEQALQLYQETNLSMVEISKTCGNISIDSIRRIIKKSGIPLRSNYYYTKKDLDDAVQLYVEGIRLVDILETANVPKVRLYRELEARGIPRRRRVLGRITPPQVDREKVYWEYQNNFSYREISEKLNISEVTVRNIVSEALEEGELELSDWELHKASDKELCSKVAELVVQSGKSVKLTSVSKGFGIAYRHLCYAVHKQKKQIQNRQTT